MSLEFNTGRTAASFGDFGPLADARAAGYRWYAAGARAAAAAADPDRERSVGEGSLKRWAYTVHLNLEC